MIEIRFDGAQPTVVARAGPIPSLRLKLIIRASHDGRNVPPGTPAPQELLLSLEPRLNLNGVAVPTVVLESGPRFGDPPSNFVHQEATWIAYVTHEVLHAIEDSRKDDVRVDFSCQMNFWSQNPENPGRPLVSAYPGFQTKLSQRDWADILDQLGFHGAWVLELPRPVVEGMAEAVKLLASAWARIEANDAVGAVSECRKAWDQADRVLEVRAAERDAAIDGLSKGEADQPSKAERIAEIRRSIDKFSQIGPHSDLYQVTMDDALVEYRLTVSMLAYLGKMTSQSM